MNGAEAEPGLEKTLVVDLWGRSARSDAGA